MKILIRLVLALVVLVVLGVVIAFSYIDSLAKTLVEDGGTYALGVDTKVEAVDVGVFEGTLAIDNLTVANPSGYQDEHFLVIDVTSLALDPESYSTDTTLANEFVLSGLTLAMESTNGDSNYQTILEHLESLSPEPGGEPAAEPADEDPIGGKSFKVDKVVIRDVEAIVRLDVLGASTGTTVTLNEIVVDDLASKELTLAELLSEIVGAVIQGVASGGSSGLTPESLDALKEQLSNLGDVDFKIDGKSVDESIDELKAKGDELEALGEGLKDGADEGEIEQLGSAIKGLLGDD